ncbi:unnamed protein product [Rotaria sp. Silwood2]|nr:unnamed protein product [Rotaria sp. Silwood2]CAF2504869.1 unnamed protein product [Rotaria sp. Silwood2]CAF2735978.1 unnamed protein product [Rotaria sp. Silwood2]CAF2903232.1 unnamed protein product [Rotaria sp. Silwood2]CAF3956307.1 unnamed protein product [Rotaria sp. Silwood2]
MKIKRKENVNNKSLEFSNSPKSPREVEIVFLPILPAAVVRRLCWLFEEAHVRSHSSGNERYLAKRCSNGDEREELLFVVEVVIGVTVANDGDGSSEAKRWLQLIA